MSENGPSLVREPLNRPVRLVKRNVQYKQGPMIGQGAFGIVYKAQELNRPQRCVAIKQMKGRGGVGVPQDAYREIKILKELSRTYSHPNIVHLERVFRVSDSRGGIALNLVYGYAEHDLAELLRIHRTKNQPLDRRVIKSMLWQILKGLSFLHENWIMHRDLKPANLLLADSKLLLADFGLARVFQGPLRSLSLDGDVVTIWYRAPELLLGSQHYTRAVDMWAVGCIFAELFLCHAIFPGTDVQRKGVVQTDQLEKIFQVLGKIGVEQWAGVVDTRFFETVKSWQGPSSGVGGFRLRLAEILNMDKKSLEYDLLMRMLCYDPEKRITAEQALEHRYFKVQPLPDENVLLNSQGSVDVYPSRDWDKERDQHGAKRGLADREEGLLKKSKYEMSE